jgi:hypothetical protein
MTRACWPAKNGRTTGGRGARFAQEPNDRSKGRNDVSAARLSGVSWIEATIDLQDKLSDVKWIPRPNCRSFESRS